MKAFTMNLARYNANTAFPNNALRTNKQTLLNNEMTLYQNQTNNPINIAGFTEVFVADNANQGNVVNALTDLGNSVGIPNNPYNIAIIRCGYTALQPNGTEVIAIVLDGNAQNINYYLAVFSVPGGMLEGWTETFFPAQGNFTYFLDVQDIWVPDYRYVVGATFLLNNNNYDIAFIHNRQPNAEQVPIALAQIRSYLKQPNNVNMLIGGDFNTQPLCNYACPCQSGIARHQITYYSTLANTTQANNYDWWMSSNTFQNTACDRTPNQPALNTTGSDHRGVGITIP